MEGIWVEDKVCYDGGDVVERRVEGKRTRG